MAIMNVAMQQGRRPALALAAGVITMSTCWGLVAVTGISTLLVRYAHALLFLKVAGGFTSSGSPGGRPARQPPRIGRQARPSNLPRNSARSIVVVF